MSSEENYDLKKSGKKFRLYPVLKDKKGNMIDGDHRLRADPNWKTEIVEGVETEEDLLSARCMANWQRRRLSAGEKTKLINDLAELYKNQGYKVLITGNELAKKIVDVTGLSQPTVNKYLNNEYKVYSQKDRKRAPKISASERIMNKLGKEVAERHEKELTEKIMKQTKTKKFKPKLEETLKIEKPPLPDLSSMFFSKNRITVEKVCRPLQSFNRMEVDIKELDGEQKREILETLLETEKRLTEWKEAINLKSDT